MDTLRKTEIIHLLIHSQTIFILLKKRQFLLRLGKLKTIETAENLFWRMRHFTPYNTVAKGNVTIRVLLLDHVLYHLR